MARRLASFMVRMKGGPTLGGSGTQLRVYDDEALTTLSTLYQRSAGGGTQPNPITPNAGKQTTLRVAAIAGDTVLAVASIAGFAVGDLVPIYDGTNTAFRVITALNPVGPTMTVDQTVGFAFATANTFVNRPSMRGHVWFYVDDVRDYYFQPKDVASTELMPPLQIPTRVPTSAIQTQDEGVSTGSARSTLNVQGVGLRIVDDAANTRVNLSYWRHDLWVAGIL